MTITIESVKETISQIVYKQLGVEPAQLLAGTAFNKLSPDFDSLSMLEIQLQLETDLGFEFESNWLRP
jgi:acyl carrier protein